VQAQRESYSENGYLLVERLIPADMVALLNAVTAGFIVQSRAERRSGTTFDLAPGHSAERPMVRRLKRPDEQHTLYWEFATGLVADVVGPDVGFHHSKLNFEWHDGGDEVKRHQDIQFYPHTNYSPLTVGLSLRDTGMDDRPLMATAPG
jgi:hypothetical protein